MEQDFYKSRLTEKFGLIVLVPVPDDIEVIHRVIYEELVKGIIKPESKQAFQQIIGKLQQQGAQGVILGCTEIVLLIKPEDVNISVFDTTQLHAEAAVEWSLASQSILEPA
jgi:aspartate racemase